MNDFASNQNLDWLLGHLQLAKEAKAMTNCELAAALLEAPDLPGKQEYLLIEMAYRLCPQLKSEDN